MAIYRRILIPVDFSECSQEALAQACDLARRFDAELHLVHVVEPFPTVTVASAEFYGDYHNYVKQQIDAARGQLSALPPPELGPKPVVRAILQGRPDQEIVSYAADHGTDLIVLGTHGRTGVNRWLIGSVSERVVRHAPCAVLVVRPAAAKREH